MTDALQLTLAASDGNLYSYQAGATEPVRAQPGPPPTTRVAFAAAHVVADPLSATDPPIAASVDWDATLAFRDHLWSLGLGVAEAMDTAQRGMGMDWATTAELIRRSCADAQASGGRIACGAGTDQVAGPADMDEVRAAYEEQIDLVEQSGGQVVIMASRALAACARSAEDYEKIYGTLLAQVRRPVILHWLGEMFDPALRGYWGAADPRTAMTTVLDIIRPTAAAVDGIKVSLLDEEFEIELRRQLPEGVRLYTGDDFNYPALIRGDGTSHSDALLGIFDGIAPAAAVALRALDTGDLDRYDAVLGPTVAFSRHVFAAPTFHYKTGIVFLAYLNGHQDHFRMVGGLESARSVPHLCRLFVLADEAGLLAQPEMAVERMRRFLAVAGVDG